MTTPDDSLLTVDEISRSWRISKMTVYRLIHSGDLKAMRVGRSLRVPASQVRTYQVKNEAKVSAREGGENGRGRP